MIGVALYELMKGGDRDARLVLGRGDGEVAFFDSELGLGEIRARGFDTGSRAAVSVEIGFESWFWARSGSEIDFKPGFFIHPATGIAADFSWVLETFKRMAPAFSVQSVHLY
jgi:hypothetical protein